MLDRLFGSARARLAWLALTPEPERELPVLVAALRRAVTPMDQRWDQRRDQHVDRHLDRPQTDRRLPLDLTAAMVAERDRLDELVLHGTARTWRRYLHEVTEVILTAGPLVPPAVARTAAEVVLDHHRMLIGLPGKGYRQTAGDRQTLADFLAGLPDPSGDRPLTTTDPRLTEEAHR